MLYARSPWFCRSALIRSSIVFSNPELPERLHASGVAVGGMEVAVGGTAVDVGTDVRVGVSVGKTVPGPGVSVGGPGVKEAVGVGEGGAGEGVAVGGWVPVRVGVRDGVREGVAVRCATTPRVGIALAVREAVPVGDGEAVVVPDVVGVWVGVPVSVGVSDGVAVLEAVGVSVKWEPGWKGVAVGSWGGCAANVKPAAAIREVGVGEGPARP